MPCARSTAQSVPSKSVTALTGRIPKADSLDSLAVVREFIRNAKPILKELTKYHFNQALLSQTQKQLTDTEKQRDNLAVQYAACRTDAASLAGTLFETKDKLGRERQKRRWNQVQKWVAFGAVATLGYFQLRPFLPP